MDIMVDNKLTPQAVLFDLDGTLIHSIDHIVACWQHAVRTCLGREITRDEILPKVGRMLLETLEEEAPGRGEDLLAVYRAYQLAHHDTAVTVVPGMHDTLETLKAAGVALGVVTSKGVPAARMGLRLFNLEPLFDTLVTYEDTTRHKPHPDPLLVACERLGIKMRPAEHTNGEAEPPATLAFPGVFYVGDAVVDILAGKAAGMRTVAVTWGAGTLETLRHADPDYIIDTMEDLPLRLGVQVPGRK
jgi:pyrophosphatase PpaX